MSQRRAQPANSASHKGAQRLGYSIHGRSIARARPTLPAASLFLSLSLTLGFLPICRTFVIGARGFEPPTARPPAGCATRLRYAPFAGQYSPRSGGTPGTREHRPRVDGHGRRTCASAHRLCARRAGGGPQGAGVDRGRSGRAGECRPWRAGARGTSRRGGCRRARSRSHRACPDRGRRRPGAASRDCTQAELAHAIRCRQAILAGALVAASWQSPSIRHVRCSQAGPAEGLVQAHRDDYARDRHPVVSATSGRWPSPAPPPMPRC